MQIDFKKCTDYELSLIIKYAGAELESRLNSQPDLIRLTTAERTITVHIPPEDDKDFCLRIKGLLLDGSYVNASERARVAEIALQFPEWVKRQGLPTDKGTGDWRKTKEFHSAKRSKER